MYGANNFSNNVFTKLRSIYICPTAAAIATVPPDPNSLTGIEPGSGPGPTFNYGMNQRINFNLPAPANVPETPFKITQAAHPSAFVVFSEQRVHASETPYYGTSPDDLSSTYNWCNRFSGRHNLGGQHCLWRRARFLFQIQSRRRCFRWENHRSQTPGHKLGVRRQLTLFG
jgi:hypothetical protein